MKLITIRRRALLRLIHAACVALFFAAAQRGEAQMFTPPFVINGSAVTTSPNGTFTSPVGFFDMTNAYSTFTVGSGVTINSTSGYGENVANPAVNQTVIAASTASFANAGSVNLNSASGYYNTVVLLTQGATSSTVTNSGSITSAGAHLNSSTALQVTSTSGNINVDNTGMLSTSNGNSATVLAVQSTTGNISITNESTGQIQNNIIGIGIAGSAGGSVLITNNGTIAGNEEGIAAQSTGNGSVQINNNGTIAVGVADLGIDAFSTSGPVSIVNSGSVSGGGNASGILAQSLSGPVSVTNTGTVSGVYYALIGDEHGSAPVTINNSGTITSSVSGIYANLSGSGSAASAIVRNTGTINSSGSGIYASAPVTVFDSGSITAPRAINIPSGSTVTLQGRAAIMGTIIGGGDPTSTSQLAFNLTIPSANLAAVRTELNAEITAYALQNGGDLTFNIDGLSYDISNFAFDGIFDNLTDGTPDRTYANIPGFESLGAVLDHLSANSVQAARILTALGNVPDAGVANALAELSPKELEVFRNVAFDNNTFHAAQVNNHLAQLRDGLTGFDSSELTVQDSSMDSSLNQVKSHLLAYNPAATPGLLSDSDAMLGGVDMKDMKSAQVNTMPKDRWSSFIAGDVILADLNNNTNLQDSNYTTGTVSAGVDYRLDDDFTLGAILSYSHTDADLDDRNSSATVDSYSPGIYASYVDGGWYGNFLGAYSRNAYTENRNIDIPGLNGDNHGGTSGNQGSANLTGGYEFHKGAFKFGPMASLEYVHLAIESLQEQGPTALDINDQNQDSLRSLIGFEARFNANVATFLGPLTLTPHVSASWQHEYMDSSQGITSQFNGAGGGSFSVQTDNPDRDSAFIDVGLDATVSQNITVFVDYETQAGQDHFFAQSAQGGVRIGF